MNLKKVLFYIPARLGDSVMLTPSLDLLKELKPNLQIDLIGESQLGLSVYQYNTNIHQSFLSGEIKDFSEFTKQYDLFVLAHPAHHCQKTIHAIYKCACKSVLVSHSPNEHQAVAALKLIHTFFASREHSLSALDFQNYKYRIPATSEDEDFHRTLGINSSDSVIIFHVGCHGVKHKLYDHFKSSRFKHQKTWAIENYIALANRFKQISNQFRFVLSGTRNESALIAKFKRQHPDSIVLMDKTSVHQLHALISNAKLFVSGDTGPMHIASATDTPQIAVFGNTSPVRTGPFPANPKKLILSDDHTDNITVDAVFSAAYNIMEITK